jgi:hypothetical protein
MAKLTDTPPSPPDTVLAADTERALRARIAELEALIEARTQTIVCMGARLAELTGDAPPSLMERARAAESALEQLASTKVLRYSRLPRRIYTSVRRRLRG